MTCFFQGSEYRSDCTPTARDHTLVFFFNITLGAVALIKLYQQITMIAHTMGHTL
jgi:hypothetical protein